MENDRVLIIDDEPKIHDVFRDILTRSSAAKEEGLDREAAFLFSRPPSASVSKPRKNFRLAFASQGQEGLELVRKSLSENTPFAVAFIDVRMPPGWDGIKTASEIRKLDQDIEIVIVTAYADKSLDEILEEVAVPERLLYIKKPFVRDEIWQLANALSAKWNLERKEKEWNAELEKKVKERTRELELAYTRLKKAETQLIQVAKISALGQLGAGIAHEINNPLTGIAGYAQFMLSKIDEFLQNKDNFKKNLEFIKKEADRCKKIIENLLKFTERSMHNFEPLILNNIINETVNLLQNQLKLNNIAVSLDLSDEPISVFGSINQIQQALINIIFNSIEAMPEGGQLKISLAVKSSNEAEIKIVDNGKGISQENLKYIFEPFFTTKRDWRNVGLGLSVVYRIIQDHRGSIDVESQPDKGTTVTIILPLSYK
jgi:signal transduction histidine kinase